MHLKIGNDIETLALWLFSWLAIKDETHQARMCAYLSAMRIFRSRDLDFSQHAQVRIRFKGLNFDHDAHSDYWRVIMGHLANPQLSLLHLGKVQQQMSSFTFTQCIVTK